MKRSVVGLAFGLMMALSLNPAWANQTLNAQQAAAKKQRDELQQRIRLLQKTIESTQSDKKDAAVALRDVESRISATDRELSTLEERQKQVQTHLNDLKKQISAQQKKQEQGQQQLAQQLRAQYANGLSPWMALLSGNDPQQIQRDLGYLGYVSEAQAEQVRALQQGVVRLEQLHAAEKNNHQELTRLATATEAQKQQLQSQFTERETVLTRVEDELKAQQQQATHLTQNDTRLGQLITGLEKEIAHQAELRRQAEIRRKAEEARRAAEQKQRAEAEAKRQADLRRQAAAAEQARIAQARQQAERLRELQAQAKNSQDEKDLAALRQAQLARDQQLLAEREAVRKAEEARLFALAHTPAQPAIEKTPPPVAVAPAVVVTEPTGGFNGLKRGLKPPVRGQVQGRFGTERPEGGPWRGIILRAPAGTSVQAIAAGRVVFSNWMAGFGNLLIIDHGAGFLSVYGHNQSVLKQVGDVVTAGTAVARVGATGGQIEPGVYFEIRQNGQPVNPQLWIGN